jgi:hypothetical protein
LAGAAVIEHDHHFCRVIVLPGIELKDRRPQISQAAIGLQFNMPCDSGFRLPYVERQREVGINCRKYLRQHHGVSFASSERWIGRSVTSGAEPSRGA